jgi:hypothetical protein
MQTKSEKFVLEKVCVGGFDSTKKVIDLLGYVLLG